MTATDELRRILDERGVEYTANERDTQWWPKDNPAGVLAENSRYPHGTLDVYGLTPEQAIAATLGLEPDDAAMGKLHDRMNVALLECERTLGIEKADGTIVVPLVFEMHNLLEEAAALGSCNCTNDCTNDCTNSERTKTCCVEETERFECLDSRYKSFDYNPYITVHVMECSACGGTYEHVNGGYEFCPRCGRRIEVDG